MQIVFDRPDENPKTMEIIDRIQDMPCMMSGIVVFENLRFRSSTLRPYPYVSVFV